MPTTAPRNLTNQISGICFLSGIEIGRKSFGWGLGCINILSRFCFSGYRRGIYWLNWDSSRFLRHTLSVCICIGSSPFRLYE